MRSCVHHARGRPLCFLGGFARHRESAIRMCYRIQASNSACPEMSERKSALPHERRKVRVYPRTKCREVRWSASKVVRCSRLSWTAWARGERHPDTQVTDSPPFSEVCVWRRRETQDIYHGHEKSILHSPHITDSELFRSWYCMRVRESRSRTVIMLAE